MYQGPQYDLAPFFGDERTPTLRDARDYVRMSKTLRILGDDRSGEFRLLTIAARIRRGATEVTP